MATYIQGVTDYIPQIQPFSPDYNFYSGSLQLSQSKADANRKRLSTLYGSLLNAPLTRDDNVASRDKFFKTIEQDIQRMAGMDLSLSANAQAAAGVFNQLLDNKSIVKDMVWTKQFQSQMQRAQGFKNCVDPEKCGGQWWEGGERLMGYHREAFRNATVDQAMNFSNAEYVAAQDITKKALALAKEADLNVSMDQVTGQWITTTKNGPLIVQPLQNLFMGSIAKDPKVKQYYQAQAELARKDFMYSNQQQYGSLEAAEQAYIDQVSVGIDKIFAGTQRTLEDEISNTEAKRTKIEGAMNGATPDKKSRLEKMRDDFNMIQGGYSSTLEEVKQANGEVVVARRNNKYTGNQIDRILSAYNMGNDINSIAQTLAYKDYEVSQKANPYGLEAASFRNRMLLEEFRHRNSMELEKYKDDLKRMAEQIEAGGAYEQNSPVAVDVAGGTTINEQDGSVYEVATRGFNEFYSDRQGLRTDLSSNEKMILADVVNRTKQAAEQGDVQAKEDFVNLGITYLKAMQQNEGVIAHKGKSGVGAENTSQAIVSASANKFMRALDNASTLDEKYQILKDQQFNPNTIRGGQVDNMYNGMISKMINPDEAGNPILRDYLAPVWAKTTDMRRNIMAKQEALNQYDKWYAQEANVVIQSMKSSNAYDQEMVDAMESYVNLDTGNMNTKADFVKNMQDKGYSESRAKELWGGDRRKSWNDPDEWGDGTYNVAASVVDFVGTTIAGGISAGTRGFDYDSPESVANVGGYQTQANRDLGGGAYDDQRFAQGGVHDEWKRVFSKYGSPDGDRAWLGITGAGDYTAMGQRYNVVDPAAYRSTSTMGTIGFLQNALGDANAVFNIGDFQGSIPEGNEEAKKIAQRVLTDMIQMKKGNSRPLATVTYADIAGGDGGKVGLNIKLTNESYINKYKGSKDSQGIFRPYADKLGSEGVTVYMDRENSNNVFTNGTKGSSLEKLMEWTGEVKFDQSPYLKNFGIRSDPNTGNYVASGMMQAGVNEQGLPDWQYYESQHGYNTDLNDLVAKYDDLIANINSQNLAIEQKYALQNRNY